MQRPGRETLSALAPLDDIRTLAASSAHQLERYTNGPFGFFGHSMGALLAYEVCRSLSAAGQPAPSWCGFSGFRAPDLPASVPRIAELPQAYFLHLVRIRYGGVPAELLRHPKTAEYFERILRADFSACETYAHVPQQPFQFPGTIVGGRSDTEVPISQLARWQSHFVQPLAIRLFDGGHLYLEQSTTLTQHLCDQLQQFL
jgi:surfactin synthase thioesterase subunit